MPIIRLLLALLAIAILSGCNLHNHNSINSSLTDRNLSKIESHFLKTNTPVTFNSNGGRTSVSFKVSELILENSISINIDEFCLSNCAEILLPSAKKVHFENAPLIGFHGNMMSYERYTQLYAQQDKEFCNWSYARSEEYLHDEKGLSKEFWKEQMERLKPKTSFEYKGNNCPWRVYNFENSLWLPTSQQLSKVWGLRFSGAVCADDFIKCSERVNKKWKKGTRIVIGDSVYVSTGRSLSSFF